jgi:hypothetical protein
VTAKRTGAVSGVGTVRRSKSLEIAAPHVLDSDLAATRAGIHQNSSIPVHQKLQPFWDNQSFSDEQVGRRCGS